LERTTNFTLYTGQSQSQTWHVTPECSGVITNCWSPNGYDFTFVQATGVSINYSAPSAGSGRIKLTATRFNGSDTGWVNVTVDATPPEIRLLAPIGNVVVEFTTIQLGWCDNTSLNSSSRWIKVNGVLRTSSFDYVANSGPADCTIKATSTSSTVPLVIGTNQVEAQICDNFNNCATTSFAITRVPPTIVVTPDAAPVIALPSTTVTQRFRLRNTGTTAATYDLAVTCPPILSACSSPLTVGLAPDADTHINVT